MLTLGTQAYSLRHCVYLGKSVYVSWVSVHVCVCGWLFEEMCESVCLCEGLVWSGSYLTFQLSVRRKVKMEKQKCAFENVIKYNAH